MLAILLAGCSTPDPTSSTRFLSGASLHPPRMDMSGGIGPDTEGGKMDHSIYRQILQEIVLPNGTVDYGRALQLQPALDGYLRQVANSYLPNLSRHEQLALLLNAFNASVLHLVVRHRDIASVLEIPSRDRWKAARWVVSGRIISLNQLEHDWIRSNFREPLALFALARGARGSAPLRGEPYNGSSLLDQLEQQLVLFLRDEANFQWDPETSTVYLSKLFDWYRTDFSHLEINLVTFVLPYIPAATAAEIVQAGSVRLEYLPFDWALNGTWNRAGER